MQATRGSIMPLAAEKRGVNVQVGDAVFVGDQKLAGTVRFSGATKFAEGEWLGIELEKKVGKNDGSVRGEAYFQCAAEHGIFVRPTAVMKRGQPTPPPSPNPAVKQTENGGDIPAPVEVEKKGGATPKDGKVVASERAKAQLDLAMAMEDHDLYRIKRFLPVAQNLGVAPQEIAAAQKLLEYDTIVVAVEDVKRLYSSIAKLRQRVEELQDKAARSTSPVLMEELEKRLWSRLEAQMTKMVAGAMAKFPAKLGAQVGVGQIYYKEGLLKKKTTSQKIVERILYILPRLYS